MPLVSIRRHWRIGLIVAAAVILLGAVVAYKKGNPLYSVSAMVYVAPRFVNILREPKEFDVASYQQFRQFAEHQSQTIKRYDIAETALKRLEEKGLGDAWQTPPETLRQAAERLMGGIKAVAIKDTYLISVSLDSGKAEHLETVLNTVIDTYVDIVHKETLFFGQDVRSNTLLKRREELAADMEVHKKRRTEIAQEIGVTTFNSNGANPFEPILMGSRVALAEAHRQVIAAQAALDAYTGKGDPHALDALAAEEISKDAGLNSLKANLLGRRATLLGKLSGLDESHPLRLQVNRELKEIDDEFSQATAKLIKETAQGYVERHRGELRKAQQVERDVEKQVEANRQKGAWFTSLYHEALTITDSLEKERRELDEIDNRLEFFRMEQQAPGFVRPESYARSPEYPIGGGRKKLFALALAAGLALGLAVPIVLDLLDRRLRTHGQAAKILGYSPMAAFFELSDNLAVRRVDADRKRRLAIALDRERGDKKSRVMLFTSVRPGAGVTGLAFELAQELAELGNRVLVIEANPLKPDTRYQADGFPGLEDFLAGDASLDALILPASGKLPDRIGIGFAAMPHFHSYPKLLGLLEECKARYDLVFLDAPPVLLSADTEYLAGRADTTLLLIGARQVMPADLRRAVDILQRVDPASIGFIVTRLEIFRGGGYFAKLVEEYGAADDSAREVLRSHPYARKPL